MACAMGHIVTPLRGLHLAAVRYAFRSRNNRGWRIRLLSWGVCDREGTFSSGPAPSRVYSPAPGPSITAFTFPANSHSSPPAPIARCVNSPRGSDELSLTCKKSSGSHTPKDRSLRQPAARCKPRSGVRMWPKAQAMGSFAGGRTSPGRGDRNNHESASFAPAGAEGLKTAAFPRLSPWATICRP